MLKALVYPAAVNKWVKGESPPGSLELGLLAKFFGKSTDYLLGIDLAVKPKEQEMVLREHGGPYWGTTNQAPIISWASAGEGHAYQDQGDGGPKIATDCKDPNCYALTVEGDSMEPYYLNGDIIVVAPNSVPDNGDLAIVKTAGDEVFFKKLKWTADRKIARLLSLNQEYEVREIPVKSIQWLHKVFSVTRILNGG